MNSNLNVLVDNLDEFIPQWSKTRVLLHVTTVTKYNLGLSKLETLWNLDPNLTTSKLWQRKYGYFEVARLLQKRLCVIRAFRCRFLVLLKIALNKQGFKYYKRFNKDATINTEVIENFDTPIEHKFLSARWFWTIRQVTKINTSTIFILLFLRRKHSFLLSKNTLMKSWHWWGD